MFKNRGGLPNFNAREEYGVPFYRRRMIVIKYDEKFLLIEMVLFFIIAILALSVYLIAYKTDFYDPISNVKEAFLNTQFISICITVLLVVLITIFTKSSKGKLIKNLVIVAMLSIIIVMSFTIIKLNIDNKYNKETFGKFYEQYEKTNEKEKNANKVSVGLSGMKILTAKESYIEKSTNAYTNFSAKVMLYLMIQIIITAILFYLIYRLCIIENKKQKLAKDDIVVYDEEENIKF